MQKAKLSGFKAVLPNQTVTPHWPQSSFIDRLTDIYVLLGVNCGNIFVTLTCYVIQLIQV